MARDHHNPRRTLEKSGMHLFDFNETLSGKRIPDERRASLEYQMEKLYKNRAPSADFLNSRPRKREESELIRNVVPKMPVKMQESLTRNRELEAKQRGPSVVARLMGLDTLPSQPKASPVEVPRNSKKKQVDPQVKPEKASVTPRYNPVQSQSLENSRFELPNPRFSDDHRRRSGVKELPEMQELEEMKRQLSLKQTLVREKLNEAKRLLTGEKLLPDRKWMGASDKLNQSKEFMDAIDFFHSNRDAFLKYVDDQDSVLGKHIQTSHPGKPLPRHVERPIPEGLRNPIVRKVIEGRREDLRNSSNSRNSDFGGSDDGFRHPVPDHQVATRIVVLKPSPNRSPSPSATSFSPGPFESGKAQTGAGAGRRLIDSPPEEPAATNPREIAKEIARQVRESVVRDLARNAAAELGSERRLNVSLDSFEGPKVSRSEYVGEGARTPTKKGSTLKPRMSLENLHFEETGRKLTSSPLPTSRKPTAPRVRQSSPPPSRPVSKGIVVLVPDQSVGSRRGSEPQKTPKRDRNRKPQEIYPENKIGDSLRKARSSDEKTGLTPRSETSSGKDDAQEIGGEVSSSGLLEGSFLLKPSASSDSQEASCECSETKEAIESEYTAEVRSPVENLCSSELVSSCGSVPSEASVVTINQEPEREPEQEPELEVESKILPPESPDRLVEADQEEVPVVKDESISKEALDVDGNSVSSENSGQPSPISVLDSSFEDSPPRVDFDTISSELEELRIQLRLLKWDGREETPANDEELHQSVDDLVVDKVVVEEEIQKPVIVEETSPAEEQELWLELDKPITTSCLEQVYVKNILLAAKMIRDDQSSTFLVECFSPRQALDPVLFEELETYYRARGGEAQVGSFKRRHLFDWVNEVLTEKFSSGKRWVPSVCCGGLLLGEVWTKLGEYLEYPAGEDLQSTVENLMEKYLSKGERWMDLRTHVEAVGLEVERLILCELIQESVSQCLGL